ncbi:MAG: hypothetical protein LBE31_05220 [Deltaproteobacteria bacterium]|jgi:hypothetical protein|nr:hypothetical protein [Deltaproteobacteria bacterium]
MANIGYDISRIDGEITATLKASDPYGLVQASILAMGSLLTNRDTSGDYWESSCLHLAGSSRSELLARLWIELLYYLRQEQLNLVKANVAEFSETSLVVECFFSSDFTLGSLLLGPEWLNGAITVPVCSEFNGKWIANIIWKAQVISRHA